MKTLTKQQIIEVLKKHNVICASASREQLAAELESLQEVDINTPFFGNSGATVPMKEESKDESRMSAEDVLKKYAKEHPRKYESFVALIENESAIDVYDFILMAMLRFASQGKDVTDDEKLVFCPDCEGNRYSKIINRQVYKCCTCSKEWIKED